MTEKIYKRNIIDLILPYIDTDNIIVLHGARQVGKTCLMRYLMDMLRAEKKQTFFIDLEDGRMVETLDKGVDSFIRYLKQSGNNLGEKLYVFIDEIQYLSNPSSFLKLTIDHHKELQLIVSGSSSFEIKRKFTNSLAGRTIDFEIYNLSFTEFLRFKEIKYLLEGVSDGVVLDKLKDLYREYVLFGGYPKVVLTDDLKMKSDYLGQILNTYVRKDIRDLAQIGDIKKFNDLLKVLSNQSGNLLNIASISSVCGLARETIEKYLFILENTYIIKLLPVWSQSAKVEVVKTPKIYFFDTGLLHILWLGMLPKTILGSSFETSVFSELVKKKGREKIHFWRTRNQTEIDFILFDQGKIVPIEVKQSFRSANKAAIMSFAGKYKTDDYRIVGLDGEKKEKKEIYPWEI